MTKAFVSWSGGKESCNAYFKALSAGFDVHCLVNMVTVDGKASMTHGISSELLQAQAKAIGVALVQRETTWHNYEQDFKKILNELRREGVEYGIFGEIDIQEHRDWVERVCKEVGIEPILPLWGMLRSKLLRDFIATGFKAIVVAANSKLFGKEWLGRRIDLSFIRDLSKLKNIDLCGEQGEYHTFVVDGPIFNKRIEIGNCTKVLKNGYWFLEISEYELYDK
ncbi:MAG: diphthine--ammonia ligase [Candidatus Thermoplasmatota archaeon]